MEELQRILHGFRQDIGDVTANVKTLRDNPVTMVCAREIALSVTKLEEAKMWLGKALGEAGSAMPENLADTAPLQENTSPAQPQSQPAQEAPQAPVEQVETVEQVQVQPNTDANVPPVEQAPVEQTQAPAQENVQPAQDNPMPQ